MPNSLIWMRQSANSRAADPPPGVRWALAAMAKPQSKNARQRRDKPCIGHSGGRLGIDSVQQSHIQLLDRAAALAAGLDGPQRWAQRLPGAGHLAGAGPAEHATVAPGQGHWPARRRRQSRAGGGHGRQRSKRRRSSLGGVPGPWRALGAPRASGGLPSTSLRRLRQVRGAGASNQVPHRNRLQHGRRSLGAGRGGAGCHPRPHRAAPTLRPHRSRMGLDHRLPGASRSAIWP